MNHYTELHTKHRMMTIPLHISRISLYSKWNIFTRNSEKNYDITRYEMHNVWHKDDRSQLVTDHDHQQMDNEL